MTNEPITRPEPDANWLAVLEGLQDAQLPIRTGMQLVSGHHVIQGEEGDEPRQHGAEVWACESGIGLPVRMLWGAKLGTWGTESNKPWGLSVIPIWDAVPDIRDEWTARRVWEDLKARATGRRDAPPVTPDKVADLAAVTMKHRDLTPEQRRESFAEATDERSKEIADGRVRRKL